jgi:hypothetical protein
LIKWFPRTWLSDSAMQVKHLLGFADQYFYAFLRTRIGCLPSIEYLASWPCHVWISRVNMTGVLDSASYREGDAVAVLDSWV